MSDDLKQVCATGWEDPIHTTTSNNTTCSKCQLPVNPNESGIRCYGFAIAHEENRCIYLLQKQLAERDAALARCVDAVKEAYISGYGKAHNDTVEGAYSPEQSADDYMEEIMASIHTSTQATAKVLAAARWIPCDEQMPDLIGRDDSHVPGGAPATLYSERVLVFDGTVRIDNLIQAEGSPETRTFYVGSRKPVTHWMPLPEPPEAIREEQEGK